MWGLPGNDGPGDHVEDAGFLPDCPGADGIEQTRMAAAGSKELERKPLAPVFRAERGRSDSHPGNPTRW